MRARRQAREGARAALRGQRGRRGLGRVDGRRCPAPRPLKRARRPAVRGGRAATRAPRATKLATSSSARSAVRAAPQARAGAVPVHEPRAGRARDRPIDASEHRPRCAATRSISVRERRHSPITKTVDGSAACGMRERPRGQETATRGRARVRRPCPCGGTPRRQSAPHDRHPTSVKGGAPGSPNQRTTGSHHLQRRSSPTTSFSFSSAGMNARLSTCNQLFTFLRMRMCSAVFDALM